MANASALRVKCWHDTIWDKENIRQKLQSQRGQCGVGQKLKTICIPFIIWREQIILLMEGISKWSLRFFLIRIPQNPVYAKNTLKSSVLSPPQFILGGELKSEFEYWPRPGAFQLLFHGLAPVCPPVAARILQRNFLLSITDAQTLSQQEFYRSLSNKSLIAFFILLENGWREADSCS